MVFGKSIYPLKFHRFQRKSPSWKFRSLGISGIDLEWYRSSRFRMADLQLGWRIYLVGIFRLKTGFSPTMHMAWVGICASRSQLGHVHILMGSSHNYRSWQQFS